MNILHRDNLERGGFAGLRETRIVMDKRAFGSHSNPGTVDGIGNFIYLADANLNAHGETRLHRHHEVDVISVMIEGNISHEGSLSHGQGLTAEDVQVQRAGGEGFSHNEINPDDQINRIIQLWMAPDNAGEPAGYHIYRPQWGQVSRVYGGGKQQDETFDSQTTLDIAMLNPNQTIEIKGQFQAYLTKGTAIINEVSATDGDFIEGNDASLTAKQPTQLLIIQKLVS